MNKGILGYLENALFFFFAVFIFGSTFSIALAQISFGLTLITFVIIIIVTRYNPFPASLKWFYIAIAAYVLWEVVSSALGRTPGDSLFMLKEEWLFLIVPVGIYLFARERYRENLIRAFALGVIIISLYGIIQHLTGIHWFRDSQLVPAYDYGYRVRGNFSHRLTFGNYYAAASVFLLGYGLAAGRTVSRNLRSWYVLAGSMGIIVTVLSYSRASIGAMIGGLLVAGLILGRKYFASMLAAVAVLAVAVWFVMPGLAGRFSNATENDLNTQYEGGRLYIWNNALKITSANPVFGVGAGNFRFEYEALLPPDIPDNRKHVHAHNDLINMAATYGIPGAVFFAAIWIALFGYLWRGWRSPGRFLYRRRYCLAAIAGSAVFFMSAATEATFADEEVRQMLMFIWAAGLWPMTENS